MYVRLNRPGLLGLSLGGMLLLGEVLEGRSRYHLHGHRAHVLQRGKFAIDAYSTSSATTTLAAAMLSTQWRDFRV